MTHRRTPPNPDRRPRPEATLARIAKDGVLTRKSALDGGVTRHEIDQRIATGFLIVESRGVFRLAGSERSGRTAQRAALATTRGTCLGLWSALAVHGVNGRVVPPKVHVMVEYPCHLKPTGWYVPHETRRMGDREVTTRDSMAVSTMARTIRDFAAAVKFAPSDAQITKWIEEALQLKKLRLKQLEAAVESERAPHTRARLRRLLDYQLGNDPQVFRSIGEMWLRDLVERRSLPMPQFNVRALGGALAEADAYWDVPLIVEFDGFAHHRTRTKHDNDRRRDRRAWRHGIPTVRITKDDFENDLPALEADIEQFVLFPPMVKRAD